MNPRKEMVQLVNQECLATFTIHNAAVTLRGKFLGAGAGGCFPFYVPTARQQIVTPAPSDLGFSQRVFRFEQKGGQVIEGRNLNESHYPYRRKRHMTQTPHFRFS